MVAVDKGWSWMIAFGGFITMFMESGIIKGLGILLPAIRQEFTTQTWIIGFGISLVPGIGALTCPLAGVLYKRFTSRSSVITLGLVSSLGLILGGMATTIPILIISFIATGCLLGAGGIAFGQVALYFDEQYDVAITIGNLGIPAGLFVMPPITKLFLELYGWRGAMFLLSAVNFHIALSGAFLKPVSKNSNKKIAKTETDGILIQEKTRERNINDLSLVDHIIRDLDLNIFCNASYVSMFIFSLCNYYTFTGWLIYIVQFATTLGLPPFKATVLESFCGIGGIIGSFVFPLCSRRFSVATLFISFTLLSTVALFMYPIFSVYYSYNGLVFASLLFGFARFVPFLNMCQIIKESVDEEQVTNAFSWIFVASSIGSLLSGFLSGWIYDQMGSFTVSFILLGTTMLLSILPYGLVMIERRWTLSE